MNTNEEKILKDNNTLLLSEKEQKAYLPYKVEDIRKILRTNKFYKNIDEVIDELYTVPLEVYKNPIISRFKEAFYLARSEKKSRKQAIELGLELMFKFNLNPVIITACKNIDELDIYLACLDSGELQDFKCFNILYKFAPVVVKEK